LSQQQGKPSRLHPCAFFSRKLSPAEVNYDIGNRDLLAIKIALEEWRHWLEGAKHPFLVLTDHKNLKYLHDAKRLNPCQARWALFFTHSNFTISQLVPRTSRRMHFPPSTALKRRWRTPNPFYPAICL
ncbi:MAG: Ty3/Gypsy family RNase HI domain-containing protein, partial [Plesiomonas sp.]